MLGSEGLIMRRLRIITSSLVLLVPFLPCATSTAREPASYLQYGCDDLVVLGRIETLGITSIDGADPLPGWQSEYQLQIQIKRVMRGKETGEIIRASAVSHSQIRNDRDFLIVLRADERGNYSLMKAALKQAGTKLAPVCGS